MSLQKLWAPWRKKFIYHKINKGCIFCQKPKTKSVKSSLILYRGKMVFVMLNLYPYNNGHLLISPYRHLSSPELLNCEEWLETNDLIAFSVKVLKNHLKPHGFNIGMNIGRVAGAGYDKHIHWHVVPRWNGDTNFMPVIGESKIISESLQELLKTLQKDFDAKK